MKVKEGTVGRKSNQINNRDYKFLQSLPGCIHTPAVLILADISGRQLQGWVGGGGRVLSQLLVQILAQALGRPAGLGSHTREICVAISDTHIINRAAWLLSLPWKGPKCKMNDRRRI